MQTEQDALPERVEQVAEWVRIAPAPDVEATAGWWLRRLGELEAEIAALETREEAELARVRGHYAALRGPIETKAGAFRRAIEAVAASVTWGKRKSIDLAWGTFGVRTKPAAVVVKDQARAVAWARAHVPDAVVVKETVAHKVVAPVVMQLVRSTGEVPEGFDYTEADVVPYATPSSLASHGGPDGDQ